MDHLRFEGNRNAPNEFFQDDLKVVFLSNVKDINLIIGANNTRKSRFLRQIINQEQKVIIKSCDDLNRIIQESATLFDEVDEANLTSINLLKFELNTPARPDQVFLDLKEFFDQKADHDITLDLLELKNSIRNINETLTKTAAINDDNETIKATIRRAHSVVSLAEQIYSGLDKNGGKYVIQRQNPIYAKGLKYIVPGVNPMDRIPHIKTKLQTLQKIETYLSILIEIELIRCDVPMVYIPALRTSRMLLGTSNDLFENTIRKQHSLTDNPKLSVETGLMLYEKIGLARNGTRQQISDFREFEKFIGQVFFQDEDVHIIAHRTSKAEDRIINISLPDELDDISIHDLGEGVQGIINLLFPIFTAKENSWIFIDEPENHLHPGYQNIFIKAISEHELLIKKNLRFFINTHSNHILSESLLSGRPPEIFVFNKRDKESTNIRSFNGNEYNTLEMLGVFNTSVLISNCTIWIEGITDRLYLKSWLHAFCEQNAKEEFKPTEGLHYSFIEYAGNNLLHYNFDDEVQSADENELMEKIKAYFVNSNAFLLADQDFKEQKHAAYKKITKSNFRYFTTKVPEIENLVPEKILMQYLIDDVGCDKDEVEKCFPISDKKIKLGAYFNEKIKYGKKYRKFEADAGGGTLSARYKKGLADYVHREIMKKTFSWEDVEADSHLIEIITELYHFIKEKNGK